MPLEQRRRLVQLVRDVGVERIEHAAIERERDGAVAERVEQFNRMRSVEVR